MCLPQLKLNNVKKLEAIFDYEEEYMIELCAVTFPKLTKFDLEISSQNKNAIYRSLKSISKLRQLTDFNIKGFPENNKLFCDSLKAIAIRCQKLKKIECNLLLTDPDVRQILSSIKAFRALKRLNLRLFESESDLNVFNDIFSIEAFKGLSNITHLTLYSDLGSFKETTLKDIDINLPNLQYLVIETPFKLTPEEVTQMADILSRLSKLKTLKLLIDSDLNNDEIEVQFLEKCKKLQNFDINRSN